jgi:hypothetical protein
VGNVVPLNLELTIWREPKNHLDDFYFCSFNLKGINRKNRHKWEYPSDASVKLPIEHSDDVPIPSISFTAEQILQTSVDDDFLETRSENDSEFEFSLLTPQRFLQNEHDDLARDLNLSKQASELLASRLKEKNQLEPDAKVTFYRETEKELLSYFVEEDNLVFCNDIENLLIKMGLTQYEPKEWRLFIDSSKRCLKCILLHNGNKYAGIPIAHSTQLKEEYYISLVLNKIKYHEHEWVICVDLKMVNFLLGQQSGYTRAIFYVIYLALVLSSPASYVSGIDKEEHWTRKNWPLRKNMEPGKLNVINNPLVERDKIILPTLHIKLGIMKQFVKALDKNGSCFSYICRKFSNVSMEKTKAGIFNAPQIRQLVKDSNFKVP